ncbi:MAG: Zn-dependent hydrolase [Bacteroidales bacterium]|nr:Zn-dependent hydrolase [Bacteroidales bacterium]
MRKIVTGIFVSLLMLMCNTSKEPNNDIMNKVNDYATIRLTADLSELSNNQKELIKILLEVAKIMDNIYWQQAYGSKEELLSLINDESLRKFVQINYGPWDRMDGNKPFVPGFGKKPAGANFYPSDMTKDEFEKMNDSTKTSQYSIIRRSENGELHTIAYHEAYSGEIIHAAKLLQEASELAGDESFKKYLELRSEALLTDNYFRSDMAWMDMKDNKIDFVVGPIENYEDELFGYRAAYEAFILLKDIEWSERLNKYATLLPELQKRLPVDEKYKSESPGTNSDLAVYDVLYYAGDANAGGKTIAINLPNDEQVQLKKGSRRLQLKNAMHAKFDSILLPLSAELITESQRKHVVFDSFFENVMFHEVAHGLGIKNTIDGNMTVRTALKEQYNTLEEGKADILGLFLITQLEEMGELEVDLMDNYTTFLAGIFRSIRFGSSSAHGKANLIRFNYFKEKGAFMRDEKGQYSVNFKMMQEAVNDLSNEIIVIQGDGDYQAAKVMVEKYGIITPELTEDLERINSKGIPVDIVFEQGKDVLGL